MTTRIIEAQTTCCVGDAEGQVFVFFELPVVFVRLSHMQAVALATRLYQAAYDAETRSRLHEEDTHAHRGGPAGGGAGGAL